MAPNTLTSIKAPRRLVGSILPLPRRRRDGQSKPALDHGALLQTTGIGTTAGNSERSHEGNGKDETGLPDAVRSMRHWSRGAVQGGGPAYLGAASLMETAPMIGPAPASWTMTAQFSKPERLTAVRSSVISIAPPRQVPMRRMSRTT